MRGKKNFFKVMVRVASRALLTDLHFFEGKYFHDYALCIMTNGIT